VRFLTSFPAADDERRIANAQTVLWLACFGPILIFAFFSMEIVFGHPEQLASFGFDALHTVIDATWLALYGVAAYLVGKRRAAGALLGLALFGRTAVTGIVEHRALSLNVAYAILGIALILRTRRVFYPVSARRP
jgi:hypothetical protein